MSAVLFDTAVRIAAAEAGRAVPRLLHSTNGTRPFQGHGETAAVAVEVDGTKKALTITAVGRDGVVHAGKGADGLAAIARAAGCRPGDLGVGPTVVFVGDSVITKLAEVAAVHANPATTDQMVAAGSSLVGWWAERFDHPGTSAAVNLLTATRMQFALGVPEGTDTDAMWRKEFGLPSDITGLLGWWDKLCSMPLLTDPVRTSVRGDMRPKMVFSTLDRTIRDDDKVFLRFGKILTEGRSWNTSESMYQSAERLNSRCDAADAYASAMLSDPLWRVRMVHSGHVATGMVSLGAKQTAARGRVELKIPRFDTRLRPGKEVVGWLGDPGRVSTDASNFFRAVVSSTSVSDSGVTLALRGFGRGDYVPEINDEITVVEAPTPDSLVSMRRSKVYEKYKTRFSWVSQGATPSATRRGVPLEVLIASAENEGS